MSIQIQYLVNFISTSDPDHVSMVQLFATIKAFLTGVTKLNDAVTTLKHIESQQIGRRGSTLQVSHDEEGTVS
jgi:hypothetical protein